MTTRSNTVHSNGFIMVWLVHRYQRKNGPYMHTVETVFETVSAANRWIELQHEHEGIYKAVRVPMMDVREVNGVFA